MIAVDRSPLREDLMKNKSLLFVKADAFTFQLREEHMQHLEIKQSDSLKRNKLDWLLADVIAYPDRIVQLLRQWLQPPSHATESRVAVKHFIITVKFQGDSYHQTLEEIKTLLNSFNNIEYQMKKLLNNKNEVTIFGETL